MSIYSQCNSNKIYIVVLVDILMYRALAHLTSSRPKNLDRSDLSIGHAISSALNEACSSRVVLYGCVSCSAAYLITHLQFYNAKQILYSRINGLSYLHFAMSIFLFHRSGYVCSYDFYNKSLSYNKHRVLNMQYDFIECNMYYKGSQNFIVIQLLFSNKVLCLLCYIVKL